MSTYGDGMATNPYYTPKPGAADRRAALAMLVDNAITRLNQGIKPTDEQAAALRDAYRSSSRALTPTSQVRAVNAITQAYHQLRKARIEAARARYEAIVAQGLRDQAQAFAAPPAAAATYNPFTGQPMPACQPVPRI